MRYLVLFILLILPSCSWLPVRTTHDFCVLYTPIRFTRAEYAGLSDESAKQILSRNETWAKLCKK